MAVRAGGNIFDQVLVNFFIIMLIIIITTYNYANYIKV